MSRSKSNQTFSMSSYQAELLLGASNTKVYEALTTHDGIRSWWTTSSEVGMAVGERIEIRFGTTFKVMRIVELQKDALIRWKVVEAYLDAPGLTRTDEWTGTEILFKLERVADSVTRLHLEHVGLTRAVECFEICSQGWARFLASLRGYVETGKGAPYTGACQ